MANNFTQFSFEVETTPEQRDWILAVHTLCQGADGWDVLKKPTIEERFAAALPLIDDCFDGNVTASVTIEPTDKGLWFYSDDCGDVEYTAELLGVFLTAFDLDTVLSFTWANTCSAMRLEEFDGGAVVIAKDDMRWLSPSRWIDGQVAEIKAVREIVTA